MKASELKGMSDEQLGLTLAETEKHLFQLRFQAATDRLESPSEIRKAKRTIARIQTEQRRRQLDKLSSATVDQLAKLLQDLQTKVDAPGKRRTKRSIERRVARLHTAALAKTAPTKSQGK